jgi:hypothetical protein
VFDQTGAMDEDAWRKARPDLITQAAVQRSAERVFKDSWKDLVPDVTASFDPTFLTPAGLFQPSRTWRFTISTNYYLFEGGLRKVVEKQRGITLEQAKLTLTELEIQARSEVRLAQEAVLSRSRALASARRSAEQAAEVVTITTSHSSWRDDEHRSDRCAARAARRGHCRGHRGKRPAARAAWICWVALGRFKYWGQTGSKPGQTTVEKLPSV